MDELARRLELLAGELTRGRDLRAQVPPAGERASSTPPPLPPGEVGPEYYLDQYVLSFRESNDGSEYFRLAVEAYAPQLLENIADLIGSPSAHARLRVRLTEMLGDGRFRGRRRALDLLLWLLRTSPDAELAAAALAAVAEIGDASTVPALERIVWWLPAVTMRAECLSLIARLARPRVNEVIGRLLASAPDDDTRARLIALLDPTRPDEALPAFERAAGMDVPIRLTAAQHVGRFRTDDVLAFVERWSAIETDERVRAALGAARRSIAEVPGWSPLQATGEPNANQDRDDPKAWASARGDMGEQWLELTYDPPRVANGARIFEVNSAGAVTQVIAKGAGHAKVVWSGDDPTTRPGVFALDFANTNFPVERLRIVLDTNRRSGWNEIDAVELLGPSGRAWAAGATASSTYGR